MSISIEDLTKFCKDKGFVYQSSSIYGGISGFWDFGPLGVELFNNLKQHWWKHFVHDKENMIGIDASIISHPRVWKASGHIDNFGDLVITCSASKEKFRADHYIEEKLGIKVEGMNADEINTIIKENNLKSPKGATFEELKDFNLLFSTQVGADEKKSSVAYLRGETAQGMFKNFKLISETSRVKLPFGIAQIGKCFRNEIAPRDFVFRSREFTIGEFEFFIHPDEKKCDVLTKEQLNLKVMLLDGETQEKNKDAMKEVTIGEMIKKKRLGEWHGYWLAEQMMWFYSIGLDKKDLKIREHTKKEISHYSSATFDIDYAYPFGSKEIAGNANRGQYDLHQHIKESGEKMHIHDPETKTNIIPRVIEPTFGMDRAFLAVIVNSYVDDKDRGNIVLQLPVFLAPIKVGVFPLVNKIKEQAKEVFDGLKKSFPCQFDTSGSVGRRYARADEIGIPYCVTFDFESVEDKTVTIRDRDSTAQRRVKIDELKGVLVGLLAGELDFEKVGKKV